MTSFTCLCKFFSIVSYITERFTNSIHCIKLCSTLYTIVYFITYCTINLTRFTFLITIISIISFLTFYFATYFINMICFRITLCTTFISRGRALFTCFMAFYTFSIGKILFIIIRFIILIPTVFYTIIIIFSVSTKVT